MDATRDPKRRQKALHQISYGDVHLALKRPKGKAREHDCSACGDPADEWAYDHADPDQRYDIATGYTYSFDQERYTPMCRSCHRAFDKNRPVAERYKHPRRPAARMPETPAAEIMERAAARAREMAARFGIPA